MHQMSSRKGRTSGQLENGRCTSQKLTKIRTNVAKVQKQPQEKRRMSPKLESGRRVFKSPKSSTTNVSKVRKGVPYVIKAHDSTTKVMKVKRAS